MGPRRLPLGLRGSFLGLPARLPGAKGPSPWSGLCAVSESHRCSAVGEAASPGASPATCQPRPAPGAPALGRLPRCVHREGTGAWLNGGGCLAAALSCGRGAPGRTCPSDGALAGIWAAVYHPRRLSTGAGSRTRAVGFEISQEEAMGAFRRDVVGHVLGPIGATAGSAQVTEVRALFLPFWAFSASVDVLYQGQVGTNQEATVWNPISRRWERVVHTQWSSTPLHQMRVDCPSSDSDMHFYASMEFPRSLVEPLAGPRLVSPPPGPLSDDMLSGNRELELFQIRREMAWSAVKRRLLRAKRQQAYDQLRKDYGASVVHSVDVDLRVLKVTAEPIFFPCYIIKYQHLGQPLMAAVSGVDGTVLGQRIFSSVKVGAAVAATLWGLGFLAATHNSVWLFSAGLLGLAVGYAARYVPLIGAALQQVGHVRDVAQLQMTDSSAAAEELRRAETSHSRARRGWGAGAQQEETGQRGRAWEEGTAWGAGAGPFVFWRTRQSGPFGGGLEEMLREMERMMREAAAREQASRSGWQRTYQQEQWQGQSTRGQSRQRAGEQWQGRGWSQQTQGSPGDPKGYYEALGLEGKGRQASQQEIKSAFRKMAMKTHPDKEPDETRRKQNEQAFKRVAEAYEVLRDPQRRAAYDSGYA